jgi:hypothetical protein
VATDEISVDDPGTDDVREMLERHLEFANSQPAGGRPRALLRWAIPGQAGALT